MSNIKQLKSNSINYLKSLQANKIEAAKAVVIILFSIYLTSKFIGSYDSTSGYDIRGEFCGYLMQFSFFAFLYLHFKSKETSNYKHIQYLSFIQLIISTTNFLIIKSLSTLFIFKLAILFAAILLFLIVIRVIAKQVI